MSGNQQIPDSQQISNVSLVAFYANKPLLLNNFIQNIQDKLGQLPGFIAYDLEQVHATILGCEGWKTKQDIINRWFYLKRNEIRYLDCAGWLEYLQSKNFKPFDISFGGYQYSQDYNFLSRNQHPFTRSFQIQKLNETTYIPVLIGWSQRNDMITLELDNLRHKAQEFNLLHKYHEENNSIDNDFYLRLGTINGKLPTQVIADIENQIRKILASQLSIKVAITKKDLAFACYQDLSLPLKSTTYILLSEITQEQLINLYLNCIEKVYTGKSNIIF